MITTLLRIAGIGFIGYYVKSKLDLTQAEETQIAFRDAIAYTKPLVGKAIKIASSSQLWYVEKTAYRIDYINYQAYVNHGSKEIVTIPDRIFNNMTGSTNKHIGENGPYWDKETN